MCVLNVTQRSNPRVQCTLSKTILKQFYDFIIIEILLYIKHVESICHTASSRPNDNNNLLFVKCSLVPLLECICNFKSAKKMLDGLQRKNNTAQDQNECH